MLPRLGASLTLVTLWLLGEWRLLDRVYDWDSAYYSGGPVSHHFFGAVVLSTGVLTAATAMVWAATGLLLRRFPGRSGERVAAVGLLAVTFVAIWHGAARAAQSSPFDGGWAVPVLLVATLVATFAAGPVRLAGVVRGALAAGSVIFPVFVMFTTWSALTAPSAGAWPKHVSPPPAAPSQVRARLVWVVFDEWDAAISGERRPAGLALPAIDRLRAEAFFATRVQAPGAWTLDALPALWLGRPLAAVRPVGPGHLLVEEHAGVPSALRGPTGTVFEDLHRLGARISLAGWHHDLCALFGVVAASCVAPANTDPSPALRRARFAQARGVTRTAGALMSWHARTLAATPSARGHASGARPENEELEWIGVEHRRIYTAVHQSVMAEVSRAEIDMVFAHYPIPHLPGLADRSDSRHSWNAAAYLANLGLMDRVLGDIRLALERAGLSGGTSLLVSSDHPLRSAIWAHYPRPAPDINDLVGDRPTERVPFILKLAHQRTGVEYPHPFSATLSRELVVELMSGRIVDYQGVAAWLDRRRTPARPR